MSWNLRRRLNLSNLLYIIGVNLNSPVSRIPQFSTPVAVENHSLLSPHRFQIPFSRFTISSNYSVSNLSIGKGFDLTDKDDVASQDNGVSDTDIDDGVTTEDDDDTVQSDARDEKLDHNIGVILDILKGKGEESSSPTPADARNKLDECEISASSELVIEVLSRTRNNWEIAFMFFLWAGKQPGYVHSLRIYHSMISILAKKRKFDTAWGIIEEMKRGRNGESLVTINTLLIMIRRYSAVHDVGSAINAFHAMKLFGFQAGIEEFQKLLAALCRYKNVQDAEHLLFSNRNTFKLQTKSFNIILNGWCNVIGSPREGQRFWKVMTERRIKLDVVSYSSIISSYSKSNKLKDVLRLYDRMKSMGIAPDRKVYNAVIHALAKGGMLKESLNLLKAMEKEGIAPNTVTYNSLIKPLSRARKRDDARLVFDEMLHRKLQPTIRTFHALLRLQRNGEDIYLLLDKMKETGCEPNKDTFIMLIRKFCRWGQVDNVFKLWGEMNERGMNDDSTSYIVLIHGLFLNGKLEEAHKVYVEMKDRSLIPDAKTDELIQTWLSNKETAELRALDSSFGSFFDIGAETPKPRAKIHRLDRERDIQKQPETRKVVKERGFSFWETQPTIAFCLDPQMETSVVGAMDSMVLCDIRLVDLPPVKYPVIVSQGVVEAIRPFEGDLLHLRQALPRGTSPSKSSMASSCTFIPTPGKRRCTTEVHTDAIAKEEAH
ncbi:hypothetical protein V2J09_001136 [Rumex salicifolius]